uniref:UTP14C small subunit processome component n=1 Tax=Electrophorus electricus TaxID=8005 RepID=A0A4W4G982_ELEEL
MCFIYIYKKEGSDDERKHAKLLEAISSLGGRRRKKHVERSEASVQVSEFSVTAGGAEEKINLCDLLGTMEKTPGAPSKTKKQLRNLQNCKETLELPLSKQQTEKVGIQRTVAYEKSTKEVSRWESVIIQNQKAEQLVFPLKQEPAGPKRMEQVVAGWKAQTPLEQEIFSILHSNKQPVLDPVLTPMEKAAIKAMSLEEAKIRRAELQKARALQSYYEAKAKRGKRIKSKKYHRVQKKAKQKEFLKQFDEMMKTNPTAALEELKKMELSRMEERMSLKHQNSGKWAKSRAIMAKYDESARSAMQEQLQLNKELTQKLVVPSDDEEERRAEEEANALPDFVNEAEPVPDSANPWMRGKLTSEASGPDVSDVAAEPGVSDVAAEPSSGQEGEQHREEEEEEEQEEEEEKLLREFERKRKLRRNEEDDLAPQPREERGSEWSLPASVVLIPHHCRTLNTSLIHVQFDSYNRARHLNQFVQLYVAIKREPQRPEPLKKPIFPPQSFAEQAAIIKEAFAGDDVISDFLKDKRKQEEAGRPKVVDLTLPGWGEWGGVGLKPSRQKRRKFRLKAAAAPPRKDQKLPAVIISEKRNASIAAHQVSQLPFPFQNSAQFESCMRSPVGQTWNTQNTVKKLTAPRVVTKLGAIIQPMAKEDFLKQKKGPEAAKQGAIPLRGTRKKGKKKDSR